MYASVGRESVAVLQGKTIALSSLWPSQFPPLPYHSGVPDYNNRSVLLLLQVPTGVLLSNLAYLTLTHLLFEAPCSF